MLKKVPSVRVVLPRLLILAGLILCGSVLRAAPVIIYSNFASNDGYSIGTGLLVTDNSFDYSVAVGFVPLHDYTLSSIDFVATRQSLDSPDSVTMSIFADTAGFPGGPALESDTLIGQTVQFGSNAPVLTVSSALDPILHANTRYWVEMDGPLGSLIWNQNTTLASGLAETDGQGSWFSSNFTQGVVRINGEEIAPAPEPASWLLMAGGLAGIGQYLRSRTA